MRHGNAGDRDRVATLSIQVSRNSRRSGRRTNLEREADRSGGIASVTVLLPTARSTSDSTGRPVAIDIAEIAMQRAPHPDPELDRLAGVEAIGGAQLARRVPATHSAGSTATGIAGRDCAPTGKHTSATLTTIGITIDDTTGRYKRAPTVFLPSPLWEKVARTARRMRGSIRGTQSLRMREECPRREPLTVFASRSTSPTRGEGSRREAGHQPYGAIVTARSRRTSSSVARNPSPRLMARGETSCATSRKDCLVDRGRVQFGERLLARPGSKVWRAFVTSHRI